MKKNAFILTLLAASFTVAGCSGETDEVPEEEVVEETPIETDGSPVDEPPEEFTDEPAEELEEETVEETTDEIVEDEPADE